MAKSVRHLSSEKVSKKHTLLLELIYPLVKALAELEDVKKVSLGNLKMLSTKVKKITISKLYNNDSAINLNCTANGVQDIRVFLNNSNAYEKLFTLIEKFSLENNYTIYKTTC